MPDTKVTKFSGKNTEVSFCSELCIGMIECVRADGDLFIGGRKPWCSPDDTTQKDVKNVIERCPSGALSVEIDGVNSEVADHENTINIGYNGPLFIRGNLEIEGAPENSSGSKFRAALCRCGASKNKPFCDNSHRDISFKDSGAVGRTNDAEIELGGPLTITPQKDSSLSIKGNLTIISSSGRKAWHGTKTALCRCGASKNKPFCDGSHKEIGFKSDN